MLQAIDFWQRVTWHISLHYDDSDGNLGIPQQSRRPDAPALRRERWVRLSLGYVHVLLTAIN